MKRLTLFAALLLSQALAWAGDWSLPLTTSTYTNFVTEVKNRDLDLALGFDPAFTTPTNIATNTIRWSSAAKKWQVWSGTAWGDLATGYDINITGNAATVTNGVYTTGAQTISGIKTLSSNPVLSGGVANGVAYLDAGKQLVTGAGMQFDGSSLAMGATPIPSGGRIQLLNGDNLAFQGPYGNLVSNALYSGGWKYITSAAASWYSQSVGGHFWYSAPSGVAGTALTFAPMMTLDVSGNLALGIYPSTWGPNSKAIQTSSYQALFSDLTGNTRHGLLFNARFDGTNYPAQTGGAYAGSYEYSAGTGQHTWRVSDGLTTAGAPITFIQALTLDAAGTLTATLNTATTAVTQAQNDKSTKVATTAYVDTAVGNGMPVGAVQYFARNTCPATWIDANGAAVSRTTYANLFSVTGTTFGAGDGTTTFNVPDIRGEFIRGWDNARGVDPGRTFGSFQYDAFQGHYHNLTGATGYSGGNSGPTNYLGQNSSNALAGNIAVSEPITNGTNGTPRTAAETRPRNVALLACIKY